MRPRTARVSLERPGVARIDQSSAGRHLAGSGYDLLSAATYDTPAFDKQGWPAQTQLAWPILGVRHFSAINRGQLLAAGASLNLAKGTAERLLDNLRSRAVEQAQALYAEVEAENARIARARPELSAAMAGESRCLRAVMHTVIKEMTRQTA